MKYEQTPSQTLGPFFAHGLTAKQYGYNFTSIANPEVAGPNAQGEHILIKGQVFDGKGDTVLDAMLEFWQADAKGKYNKAQQDPSAIDFKGFGRTGTETSNRNEFCVKTIKPGAVKGQAPCINVILFMRGMLNHQFTSIYFSDEKEANQNDSILNSVPKIRRNTLIAKRKEKNGVVEYIFNIYMQGKKETVFFDL